MRSNLSSVETLSPFSLRFSEIPNTSFGFCYLLRSLKLPHLFYVGRCKNLRRRVHEHNSGHGSEFTKPIPCRPWTLFAYVHGFADVAGNSLSSFEVDWQKAMSRRKRNVVQLKLADYLSECDVLIDLYRCTNVEGSLRCECLVKTSVYGGTN